MKLDGDNAGRVMTGSHPARGAWIEIALDAAKQKAGEVAPRKGCVD